MTDGPAAAPQPPADASYPWLKSYPRDVAWRQTLRIGPVPGLLDEAERRLEDALAEPREVPPTVRAAVGGEALAPAPPAAGPGIPLPVTSAREDGGTRSRPLRLPSLTGPHGLAIIGGSILILGLAFAHFDALVRRAIVQNVRGIMEQPAYAVTAKVPHDGTPFVLGKSLDRCTDSARACTRPHGGDAAHKTFMRDFQQPLGCTLDLADGVHATGIAVPAI